MSMTTLYERQKENVRVVAFQEGSEVAEGKFVYKVQGFVNGEMVQDNVIEAGYRATPGAARALFKELAVAHNPKPVKPAKEVKAYTAEELDALIAKSTASIEKAQTRHAKLVEQRAQVEAGEVVTNEGEDVAPNEIQTETEAE